MITPTGDGRAAVDTLRHVEAVERRTRHDLQAFWFPLVLFGALTLASAPFHLGRDGAGVALFWAVAGPVGAVVVGRYFHSREVRLGLYRRSWPYLVTAGGLLLAAFVLPALTTGDLQEVVSAFAVAGAYLLFARYERSAVLAGLAVVLAAVPAAALASGADRPGLLTAVGTGLAGLLTGAVAARSGR